ncbi:hypothetical protein [Microbacterium algeriense]|uniref:hypothetical protein n=1 Tax=Microbacterium algeriense TaxID=2615184 RepID=UPI0022E76EE9|nr:hypothetical protein [Microbacterium algeriense]
MARDDSESWFEFDAVDFVTSDHHFGHARIAEIAGRPFASVEEMSAAMVEQWNMHVRPDQVVLHLGDLALGPIEQSVGVTSQLNGHRLLVPGNHDRVSLATQSNRAVERFRLLYEEAGWTVLPEVRDGYRLGTRLRASHYPYVGDTTGVERHRAHRPLDDGTRLLHGHTHDREYGPHGSHEFPVGVDAFAYAPVPFELVDAWLEDLRHEDEQIAANARAPQAGGETVSLDTLEGTFGVDRRDDDGTQGGGGA